MSVLASASPSVLAIPTSEPSPSPRNPFCFGDSVRVYSDCLSDLIWQLTDVPIQDLNEYAIGLEGHIERIGLTLDQLSESVSPQLRAYLNEINSNLDDLRRQAGFIYKSHDPEVLSQILADVSEASLVVHLQSGDLFPAGTTSISEATRKLLNELVARTRSLIEFARDGKAARIRVVEAYGVARERLKDIRSNLADAERLFDAADSPLSPQDDPSALRTEAVRHLASAIGLLENLKLHISAPEGEEDTIQTVVNGLRGIVNLVSKMPNLGTQSGAVTGFQLAGNNVHVAQPLDRLLILDGVRSVLRKHHYQSGILDAVKITAWVFPLSGTPSDPNERVTTWRDRRRRWVRTGISKLLVPLEYPPDSEQLARDLLVEIIE